MRSPDFFTQKAKQYISEFDILIDSHISRKDKENSLYTKDAFLIIDKYRNQELIISELKMKTILLFSEFDKGDIFIKNIHLYNEKIGNILQEKEHLLFYKRSLELFIEHITEFRE